MAQLALPALELALLRDRFTRETPVRPGVTTSVFTVGGKPFGYACEDQDRGLDASMSLDEIVRLKVSGRTAIPAGRYRVKRTWSPKYQRLMPLLLDTKGYKGIRIHAGNDADDTEGCILPGKTRHATGVQVSAKWAKWLDDAIAAAELAGREVWITITRDPAVWAAFQES